MVADKGQVQQPNDLVSVTTQFWRSDLEFIDKLADHRLETRMDLRRLALHVGSLIVAAAGPSDRATGLYAKTFTREELAREIVESDVAKAALFVERSGLTLIPVSVALVEAIKEAFAGNETNVRSAPAPAPVVVPPAANGQRSVQVSTSARRRMNFNADVTL